MKPFLLLLLLVANFLVGGVARIDTAHAATYPLTISVTTTAVTATMTGVPNDTAQYKLEILRAPFSTIAAQNTQNTLPVGTASDLIKPVTNNVVAWSISGINPATTLYIRAVKLNGISPGTDEPVTATQTIINGSAGIPDDTYRWPLTFVPTGQTAMISGLIDTTKYPNTSALELQLHYARTPFTTPAGPSDKLIAKAHTTDGGSVEGVASDGSYYWNISGLTPGTKYYFRHVVLLKGTATVLNSRAGDFDSTKGYIGAGSQAEKAAFDAKSYHLLAPWPGLAVLMDPDLCYQKKYVEKTVSENSVCDINGFLNFAFKTLIGLTAVVLVLRLMYEGYAILTSDVPFIQAKSKEGFKTALIGLLLALSAYLILNTINPKLVENSINVASVEVGVDEETELEPNNIYAVGGDTKSCPEGFVDVTTFGTPNKINVCKSIAQKLTAMIAAAKNNNIILTGYGSRSTIRQKQLRVAHGCPDESTPSTSCRPPTARPGHSMHERGMAIDFSCNGSRIGQRDHSNPCYVWLSINAAKYGFKNLPSEAWHWSVNGK